MSAFLLAALLLSDPPAASPASPTPSPSPRPSPRPSAKPEPSLGEVARRTPSPAPKASPAKVLTNDDLEKSREGGAAVSVLKVDGLDAPPVDLGPTQGSQGAAAEVQWRMKAQDIRSRIAETEPRIAQIEERLAGLRNDMQPTNAMGANREQERQAAIQAATAELETVRADLASARQAMTDLEDKARREGVPPGWLREP